MKQAPKDYSHLLAGALNATCGISWSIAYVLYVKQAQRDHSYGMPLAALLLNFTWEFVYTFLQPVHGIGRVTHFPWLFLDSQLLLLTIQNGPHMWKESSPLIAENFLPISIVGGLLALSAQWTFSKQFINHNPSFWSAYMCQNIISWGSILMLLSRGNCSGHSLPIWFFRFAGSLAANLRYLYRAYAWPQRYEFILGGFTIWLLWMPTLADLIYVLTFKIVN
ncbi:hypothetical protein J3R30DRAFT_3531111 [Lentinula aciculospora]|uniref:Integral membrane protein n=1 Tax=Lentinula aciculospora TaxID=153920 RepID=A0A9W8ZZF9_9AGAR|nr:hypothetical protein J3R30DRAFT_3531111 [Lentinula aciculospora]